MKRRTFLKRLGITTAIVAAAPVAVSVATKAFEGKFAGETLYGSGGFPEPFKIDTVNKTIEYVGGKQQFTVLELHRWLQDQADDFPTEDSDKLCILDPNPSIRKTDHIIELVNDYRIIRTNDGELLPWIKEGSLAWMEGEDRVLLISNVKIR